MPESVQWLTLKAVVNIDAGGQSLGILMFVFVGQSDDRRTASSNEGELHWVRANQLPEEDLVEDLAWLIPRVLEMEPGEPPLFLQYSYDKDDKLIIRAVNRFYSAK